MDSKRNIVLGVCLLVLVGLAPTSAQVCPYNVPACTCNENIVSCFQLQEIPPLTNASNVTFITAAIFDTGNITSVNNGSLPPGLITLEFTGHPLTNISDDAFENSAETLTGLTINKSNLGRLPKALLNLTHLASLTIGDTHIDAWDDDILLHIANTLTVLSLPNVGLQKWPMWFSYFPLLTAAELSRNTLSSVPEDAFIYINNTLLSLKLKQCNFTGIPEALSSLSNLTLLDISGNNIDDGQVEELANLPFTRVIKELYLDSTELTRIPDLYNMTSLLKLFLERSQIQNSTASLLPRSVTTLYLASNNLTAVPYDIDDLHNLLIVNLKLNAITEVSFDMFPTRLISLDLSLNQLNKIAKAIESDSSLLETLYLDHNPLTEIEPSAFKNLVSLTQLDLRFTRLTRLPLALSSLKQLSTLQMSNVTSLSCPSPPPESLVKWLRSSGSVIIYGDCNSGISIHDYLTIWATTRATTQRKYPTGSGGPYDITTLGNTSTTDNADAHKPWLLQIFSCLLLLLSTGYYT
ncbi:hypothetical protein BsWGS_24318 [Bradybaena similaris]